MNSFSIAIDGPAGVGKSTIAKIVASKLGIEYIDTGAMYRAFTLKLMQKKTDLNDVKSISNLLKDTNIDFENGHIYLDGLVVDEQIRDNTISNNVSNVSKLKDVREKLVQIQRDIANCKNVVMDGRDIGTSVLPNSKYKFFLTASIDIRAERRFNELKSKDNFVAIDLETIKNEIKKRDDIDSTREISPLVKATDAIEIDTTLKNIDEVVSMIIDIVEKED